MAKPYHIKLKRTTKNLTNTDVQNYNDLKWGEPILVDNKYLVVGDKTNTQDENGDYISQKVEKLNVFRAVLQSVKDAFTFWKANTSAPPTSGTHVTLTKEDGTAILPDTDANYIAYNDSATYSNGTIGKALQGKADIDNIALTGTPTAPDINNPATRSQLATKNYFESSISGTSGYLAKFTGAHKIENGPQLGSSTTTYLNNAGNWATPTDPRVAMTGASQSGDFPVLLKANPNFTNETDGTIFTNGTNKVTINPSTGTINAVSASFSNSITINGKDVSPKSGGTVTLIGGSGSGKWNSSTLQQTVTVSNVSSNSYIVVGPSPTTTNIDNYVNAGIFCSAQANGTLTFTCKLIPTANIGVNVIIWG